MIQEKLFEPILNVVYETMPRDNLLNSACLEFFEHIKRENLKMLIIHLVENYREKIEGIDYVATFKNLIIKYNQYQGYQPNAEHSFADTEEDTPGHSQKGDGRRWQGMRDLDPAEEDYFNTSDDEEDSAEKTAAARTSVNGASPLSKPLVDYNSDNSDEGNGTAESSDDVYAAIKKDLDIAEAMLNEEPEYTMDDKLLQDKMQKRRREEDEEDELSKLSQQSNKRRNSNSSTSSKASSSTNTLKRKQSFTNGKDGPGGSKKISISLAPAIKSGGEGSSGLDDDN